MAISRFGNIEEDSAAAPIIKQIALEILKNNQGKPVPLRFIRDHVFDLTEKEFSSGSYSGAMRDLIEESRGRVVNVERGYYLYETNIKRKNINDAIQKLIEDLDGIATDNILKMSDEDLETIRKIPSLQESLQALKLY